MLTNKEKNDIYEAAREVYAEMESKHRKQKFSCFSYDMRYWNDVHNLMYHIENGLNLGINELDTAIKILGSKRPERYSLMDKCRSEKEKKLWGEEI